MRLRFVGSDSPSGSCPTIYETDRDTYVIQGQVVTDPEALNDLRHVLTGETFVEVPKELLRYAKETHPDA
jgi:hypothetical protein